MISPFVNSKRSLSKSRVAQPVIILRQFYHWINGKKELIDRYIPRNEFSSL